MTSDNATTPLLDMAAPASGFTEALASACRDYGFFQVTNHGIPERLLHSALDVSNAFFRQPAADKQAHSRTKEQPWGYYDRELTKNLRDRKEIFDIGHTGYVPWPGTPPTFKAVNLEFRAAIHAFAVKLSVLIAQSLALPTEPIAKLSDQHSSFTRLNRYPVDDPLADSSAPTAGPLGISHHTDAGALTVLLQDTVSGLQMLHKDQWANVPARPNTLTINLGDMFQVWSNDRVSAPVHRVLASESQERFSIAYFLNPGEDCMIAPLLPPGFESQARYRAFLWAEFRGLRALGDYGNYGEEVQISHYRRDPR